jgi:ABC transporter DrrB family efflux protein
VLQQLRRDPRSVALLVVVPCLLMALLRWLYAHERETFDAIGGPLLGIFPFVTMFLVTSVATLRERTSGTLERLLTMPIGKGDVIGGYALAFGAMAVLQAGAASGVTVGLLGLHLAGSPAVVVGVAVLDALLGTALGLMLSAFARTEFQAVQFMPAVVLPQFLLCGLFVERARMGSALRAIADVFPLTYAVDAMARVTRTGAADSAVRIDVVAVAVATVVALLLGALTLRRRTA